MDEFRCSLSTSPLPPGAGDPKVQRSDTRSELVLGVAIYVRKTVLGVGLEALVSEVALVDRVHNCASWTQAERLVQSGEVGALILHESDTHALSAEAIERVRQRAKVLVIIEDYHAKKIFDFQMSPDGLLLESELTTASLTDALQRTLAGEIPMPSGLTRELMERASGAIPFIQPRSHGMNLTPREMETLALLAEGLGNKQIARRLQISSHGAKRLVANLLLKLGSANRTTAVVTAVQAGLIELGSEERSRAAADA
jgi:two-component system nitrate/nitrite response regulator NarL